MRALVAAAAASTGLSACTISFVNQSPSPAPEHGGVLTIGVWPEPAGFLDASVLAHEAAAAVLTAPVQEGLLWYRPASDTASTATEADYWTPDLATEVPTTANGDVKTSGCGNAKVAMCVTWKLRPGVRWQDGSAFTSHDVCDTYRLYWLQYGAQQASNPTPIGSTAGWDQVTGCSESDPNTATVDFKSQYGQYLTLGSGASGILPASIVDRAFAQGVSLNALTVHLDLRAGSGNSTAFDGTVTAGNVLDGTGPYVLQTYTPGRDVVLVASKQYWDQQHQPHLDKLTVRFEPSLAAERRDVISGAVGIAFDLRLSSLTPLRSAIASGAPITLMRIPASGAEKVDLNLCAAPSGTCSGPAALNPYTSDPTVRKAMLEGIDRTALSRAVAAGAAVPKDSWWYLGATYLDSAGVPSTGYDPAAAESLLDAAGDTRNAKCGRAPAGGAYRQWKDGSCIVVKLGTTSDDATRLEEESMLRADLARIGIDVPAEFSPNLPAGRFFAGFTAGGPLYTHAFDTALYAMTMSEPGDPDTLAAAYHGDCSGACPAASQIPSSLNGGTGLDATGLSDPQLDADLDRARSTADLAQQAMLYVDAEQRLAATIPEIPLFQQVVVDAHTNRLHNVASNDIVWDYNVADWYCSAGTGGRGDCGG